MKAIVDFSQIEKKILLIRDQQVLLDYDVAALYEVKTKEVNQAVRNNPDKFLKGYLMELRAYPNNSFCTKYELAGRTSG
ncbi:MAG: ORF6N domain-containing protein [Verrucomicrobiales bacterium]|nr:ORF6N domain-containing protein [Verrucomicrobiales bacterium]